MPPPATPHATEIDLDALCVALARALRAAVHLVDAREREGRFESITLSIERPEQARIEIDVAHVATFESSTWEPAPRDLSSLVGARGHTLHSKDGAVGFRLATWTDRFVADRMAEAILKRLAAEPSPAR